MAGPDLVSLDVLGTDDELATAMRSAGPPREGPPHEAEGRDETRAVVVRMNQAGKVTDVVISVWWRDHLSPSDLQDALLSAYRSAFAQAASTLGSALPRAAPWKGRPTTADTALDLGDAEWLEGVRWRLDRTQDVLDRAEAMRLRRPADRVVTGPAGLVRFHVRGDIVTRVEISRNTALRESANRVAADALAAFQDVRGDRGTGQIEWTR